MTPDRNTWTEQLYRYAEHLYWEPQHINKRTPPGQGGMAAFEKTRRAIRKQEVPLNILFNIVMRLLPSRIKRQVLRCFVASSELIPEQQIEYLDIYAQVDELDFIQPDMVLESEQVRMCIELKIDASLSLDQLYKYLFLFGRWQAKTGVDRTPYLFFLTKRHLQAQWKSQERGIVFTEADDLASLYNYLRTHDLPNEFGLGGSLVNLHGEVKKVIDQVQLGWASWQTVGNVLQKESDLLNGVPLSDAEEVLKRLIDDFLNELHRRKLWSSTN